MSVTIRVIGGGLAGCEASYQLVKAGYNVELYEMRKIKMTPAHHTIKLGELVCSNSLKSSLDDTASGALKLELDSLDCMMLKAARLTSVPAGGALAVNRELYSDKIEAILSSYHNFKRIDEEVVNIDKDKYTIIATGPLTSDSLASEISRMIQDKASLHFYDAAAPIIMADGIDYDKAFFATRYNKGDESDYLNCGMNKDEYLAFYNELVNAERAIGHEFDKKDFYEGCMPIEVMARRGVETIRYGMMKPKGIVNPNNGERYYAVVQLRAENIEKTAYNLVGFQTNLKFAEQKRVFSMIPALNNCEIVRYGVMHRNTYLNSPEILTSALKLKGDNKTYFAGQITGVEGYVESIMTGLVAAKNVIADIEGLGEYLPPNTTIIGALLRHISNPNDNFQPMNSNFGILPPLEEIVKDKKSRKLSYSNRCIGDIMKYNASYDGQTKYK